MADGLLEQQERLSDAPTRNLTSQEMTQLLISKVQIELFKSLFGLQQPLVSSDSR
jgi:hypothetical protein